MKNKLAIFDMDGTLFDTKDVNYYAYQKALKKYNFNISYDFYRNECNGRLYKVFLPSIVGDNSDIIEDIHNLKKEYYSQFLDKAIVNQHLFNMIELLKSEYYIALVTTASKKNTIDILEFFNKQNCFDLILTHNDVTKPKPDPEGFLIAMQKFGVSSSNTIVFEDSKPGIDAALQSGANVLVVKGFN